MSTELMWLIFGVSVLGMLALDLGVFHRDSHEIKIKEALTWSVIWIAVSGAFACLVYVWHGSQAAMEYTTAYVVEKALSVDNLFVFLMIFTHFRVPTKYQHKILFWGIIGALLMRAVFIGMGVALIEQFHFVIYIFGAVLIWSGIKMAMHKEDDAPDFDKSFAMRLAKKIFPITNSLGEGHFFTKIGGKTHATMMFVVLMIVESTDVLFAVDSVPAVLAISRDPLIVYSSNVFAILGLRSLYFALAGLLTYFHFLNYGLCVILLFVGGKMMASGFYHVPTWLSLCVILGILILSVIASLIWPQKTEATEIKS